MSRIAVRRGLLVRIAQWLTRREYGRELEPVGIYGHLPSLLIGYGVFERATGRQQRVDQRLKALAETKVAALVDCEFCCDIGSSQARRAGISEAQLLALPAYRDSDEFTALERLVLDYATAISRTPARVAERQISELRRHFDERQLVELTNAIALENMRARFNAAFEMTPAGFSEGRVCVVPHEPDAQQPGRDTPAEPRRGGAAAG